VRGKSEAAATQCHTQVVGSEQLMTVRDKVHEDMRHSAIIAATVPSPCVICGMTRERRYGCCIDCAESTDFNDPRVLRDRRLNDPIAI